MNLDESGSLYKAEKYVKDFHERFKFPIGSAPRVDSFESLDVALRLIREEAGELHEACGYTEAGFIFKSSPVEIAHECADLIFVTLGLAVRCGIDLSPIFSAVSAANMAKSGPDGPVYREDGKLLKPANWKPADVKSLIEKQCKAAPKDWKSMPMTKQAHMDVLSESEDAK